MSQATLVLTQEERELVIALRAARIKAYAMRDVVQSAQQVFSAKSVDDIDDEFSQLCCHWDSVGIQLILN